MTGGPRATRRAIRYALNLPLRYRVRGGHAWSYGMTVNISGSGVLLRTSQGAELASPVEMQVVLPGDDEGSACVIGRGSVRRGPRPDSGDQVVALSIDEYELVRTARNET